MAIPRSKSRLFYRRQLDVHRLKTCKRSALSVSIALGLLAHPAFAKVDRIDMDIDDDGLIEIYDGQDFLEIGASVDPVKTLYGVDTGCPPDGCIGYELANDVDLSANQHHQAALPFFMGVLEGNGFSVRGLDINGSESEIGLIREAHKATIRNLAIEDSEINGFGYVAALVGAAKDILMLNCHVRESVELNSESFSGGLVGHSSNSTYVGNTVAAKFQTEYGQQEVFSPAGLIASSFGDYIVANHVHARLIQARHAAGLVSGANGSRLVANSVHGEIDAGYAFVGSDRSSTLIANYSAAEIVPESQNDPNLEAVANYVLANKGDFEFQGGIAVSIDDLRCPEAGSNSSCTDTLMFDGWESYTDDNGNPIWQFGNAQTLPYISEELVLADSDDDQVLDSEDHYPFNRFAHTDSDGDGAPDDWSWSRLCKVDCTTESGLMLDAFPEHPEASIDADADGKPDAWHSDCDSSCQQASDLVLDEQETASPDQDPQDDAVAGGMSGLTLLLTCMLWVLRWGRNRAAAETAG